MASVHIKAKKGTCHAFIMATPSQTSESTITSLLKGVVIIYRWWVVEIQNLGALKICPPRNNWELFFLSVLLKSCALWSLYSLGSGNGSCYTATMYFSYTILGIPELKQHKHAVR